MEFVYVRMRVALGTQSVFARVDGGVIPFAKPAYQAGTPTQALSQ